MYSYRAYIYVNIGCNVYIQSTRNINSCYAGVIISMNGKNIALTDALRKFIKCSIVHTDVFTAFVKSQAYFKRLTIK